MYFYAQKEDKIEKYLLKYDEESLKDLRGEIIDNCSLIEHCEYDATLKPTSTDKYKIRNLTEELLYKNESRASLPYPDEDIYHYSYDKYIYPEFVLYIDKFLNGDTQIIGTPIKITNPRVYLETKIKELSTIIDRISNFQIENKQIALAKLKKLIEQLNLNKNQKSADEYIERFNELIQVELVDTITLDEIERVQRFFESSETYDKVLGRKKNN